MKVKLSTVINSILFLCKNFAVKELKISINATSCFCWIIIFCFACIVLLFYKALNFVRLKSVVLTLLLVKDKEANSACIFALKFLIDLMSLVFINANFFLYFFFFLILLRDVWVSFKQREKVVFKSIFWLFKLFFLISSSR